MLYFMAIESGDEVEENNRTYDDLHSAFEELYEEMKKILKKNIISKYENIALQNSNKELKVENSELSKIEKSSSIDSRTCDKKSEIKQRNK